MVVDFVYESRPDNITTYEAGSKVQRHPVRLKTIRTKVSGNVVSKYNLSYETVGADSRSRLTQIERCDASNNCQDPIDLAWWHDGTTTFSVSSRAVPHYAGNSSNYNSDAAKTGFSYNIPRWHDMNGDSIPEYVHAVPNTNGYYPSTNMSFEIREFTDDSTYTTSTWASGVGGHPSGLFWLDVDGDGQTDLASFRSVAFDKVVDVSLSTGSGFDNTSAFDDFSFPSGKSQHFADMNGDGLLDIVVMRPTKVFSSPGCTWAFCPKVQVKVRVDVYANNGNGFDPVVQWIGDEVGSYESLMDLTGDGLKDLVVNGRYVYINDGTKFDTTRHDFGMTPGNYPTVAYADVDGNGVLDRKVRKAGGACCDVQINTGKAFIHWNSSDVTPTTTIDENRQWDAYVRDGPGRLLEYLAWVPGLLTTDVELKLAQDDTGSNYELSTLTYASENLTAFGQWTDLNGDGLKDLTMATTSVCETGSRVTSPPFVWTLQQNYYCETGTLKVLTQNGHPDNLLKKVTQGGDVETVFTYKPLSDSSVYTKGNSAVFPDYDIQDTSRVVSQMTQSNGIGGVSTVDYTYEGLIRNVQGRGELGYASITANNVTKGSVSTTEYAQQYPYSSQPIKVQMRRASDNRLLKQIDTSYVTRITATPDVQYPYVSSRVEKSYALSDGRLLSTQTTTNMQVDAYGNIGDTLVVLQDHENSQTFQTQTVNTFNIQNSFSTWRVGELASTVSRAWLNGGNDPSKDRRTDYTYDATTGLLLTEVREPGKGVGIELTKMLAYDAVGNVISESLSGPGMIIRTNTIAYDANGLFPITMTNPLGHVVDQTWDAAFGVKLTETDANNQTTTWSYNSFGMLETETRPDGAMTDNALQRCDSQNAMCASLGATIYVETLTSGAAPARTYLDQLGRTVRTRSQAFDGRYVNQDTQYDSLGRAYRTSEPFFDGDPVVWSTQTYDFLDRVTALTAADPVASGTTVYDGYTVSISDAASRTETRTVNAAGEVIQVVDKAGTTMTFQYDPVGNRKQVNNAVGLPQASSVYYSYDRLGRLLSQNDPDHGVYTYTYDTLGNKLSEVSPELAAASQSITYQYDLLNRMTSRSEPEGTTNWAYDSTVGGNLGAGKLHSESQTGFTRTYTYASGNYGRLTDTTTQIGANTYTSSASYDALGRMQTQTYPGSAAEPSGFQIEYVYSPVGMLEAVQSLGGGTVFYQLLGTDASGRLTSEWMGDGSTVSQSYAGHSSRIASQQSAQGATIVQDFNYTYDGTGNMLSRTDARLSLSEAFTFDTLDRLTTAQVGANPVVTYGFDVTGSITQKSDVATAYLYTTPALHAVGQVNQIGGLPPKTYGYNANGNLETVDGTPTVSWSSYNKPTQITSGTITYQFEYGPDRKRFKKTRNGTVTHYVGESFEAIDPQGILDTYRHYIRANGKTVLVREDVAGAVSHRYVHRDHLGSVTTLTDEITGNVVERYSYDAWGMRRSAADWQSSVTSALENRGYTGHEHLDDVGIIHMNGRIYSPSLGRMLSPDPVTQAPENGQNYNRFTYAFNNPLKYTDPSGFVVGVDDAIVAAVVNAVITEAIDRVLDMLFGGSNCGNSCRLKKVSIRWCESDPECRGNVSNVRGRAQRWNAMRYEFERFVFDNQLGDEISLKNEVKQPALPVIERGSGVAWDFSTYWNKAEGGWKEAEGEKTPYFAVAAKGGNYRFRKLKGITVRSPYKYTDYWVSTRSDMKNAFLIRDVVSTRAFDADGQPSVWGQIRPEPCRRGRIGSSSGQGCGREPKFKVFRVHKYPHTELWGRIEQEIATQGGSEDS